jgi:hypothetical protein
MNFEGLAVSSWWEPSSKRIRTLPLLHDRFGDFSYKSATLNASEIEPGGMILAALNGLP